MSDDKLNKAKALLEALLQARRYLEERNAGQAAWWAEPRKVESLLDDLLRGGYPGDRELLVFLLNRDPRVNVPERIAQGGLDTAGERKYAAKDIAGAYYRDPAAVQVGIGIWHFVLQADAATVRNGAVDDATARRLLRSGAPPAKPASPPKPAPSPPPRPTPAPPPPPPKPTPPPPPPRPAPSRPPQQPSGGFGWFMLVVAGIFIAALAMNSGKSPSRPSPPPPVASRPSPAPPPAVSPRQPTPPPVAPAPSTPSWQTSQRSDAETLFRTGEKYRLGQVVGQDDAQAAMWYRRAADQGHALARSQLAAQYYRGHGVPKDEGRARALGGAAAQPIADAARRGDPVACFHLGRLYHLGLGVPQDDGQAIAWYREAAQRGVAEAQNNLGQMYKTGRGAALPRDDAQAAYWFHRAAEQGYTWGEFNYGLMCARGQGTEQDEREAAMWYGRAAEKGFLWAQYRLALLYSKGQGVARDDARAAYWFRKAAEQGYDAAQFHMGNMYSEGRGVPLDYAQAAAWYRRAAAQGHDGAQKALRRLEDHAAYPNG